MPPPAARDDGALEARAGEEILPGALPLPILQPPTAAVSHRGCSSEQCWV